MKWFIQVQRGEMSDRTDVVHGKLGFKVGMHEWQIEWPKYQRGSHAVIAIVIGVASAAAAVACEGTYYWCVWHCT